MFAQGCKGELSEGVKCIDCGKYLNAVVVE